MSETPGGQPGAHPLTSLQKAFKKRPLYSEPIEIDLGGEVLATIVWRELKQPERDELRMEAIDAVSARHHQFVANARRRGRDWDEFEWSLPAGEMEHLIDNEHDARLLHHAACDPETKQPAATLKEIREGISPELQQHLANVYQIWTESISPDTMDLDDVMALWEAVKKNPRESELYLMRSGFKTALVLLRTLAEHPEMLETEKSSPTSSSETTH